MKKALLIVGVAIAIGSAGVIFLSEINPERLWANISYNTVDSFKTCIEDGNIVIESNPPRCIAEDNSVYYGSYGAMDFSEPKITATTVPLVSPSPTQISGVTTSAEHPLSNTPQATVAVTALPTPQATVQTASAFDPLADVSMADLPPKVVLDVPFTPQAPNANWDQPFDEACEEAAVIMVQYYLMGGSLNAEIATDAIIRLTDHNRELGYSADTTIHETALVAESYYDVEATVYAEDEVSIPNIKALLSTGHPVIIPAAGRRLGNPYYSGEGPPYHMLVIIGYEDGEFITNDPGTKRGAGYRYDQDLLVDVNHDWTGSKATIREGAKRMMILKK